LVFLDLENGEVDELKGLSFEIAFSSLIEKAGDPNEKARAWAVFSLGKLYEWGLFSKFQQEEFANALWAHLDDYGLPANTGFYRFAFLKMPSPP